ncbi:MAG: flagellar motor switch protein FliN [Pirellulales bacterium]|nr:flagellar motor switch protein FliN [Pirellulales bacterium]
MLSGGAKPAAEGPADADKLLAQDDIEKLLSKAGAGGQKPTTVMEPPPKTASVGPSPAGAGTMVGEGTMAAKDVEFLLEQAQRAIESIDAPTSERAIPGVDSFHLQQFTGAPASAEIATLDLIRDVDLDVQIELGRTHMYLEDVLKLRKGSVVPLDKLAGDPVDIFVNGRLVARGEVLVLNDNFCVRVAELIAGVGA